MLLSEPFTKYRACKFALLWLAAIFLVFMVFYELMQVRSGQSVTAPQGSSPHKESN
jgi:hypothetical protein